jgi:HAD superfamily hydrolase (TIGR01509 family)
MPAPYQALVFDLGNVIATHDNAVLYRRLAAECTASDALAQLKAALADRDLGTGRIGVRDIHQRLVRELGLKTAWSDFPALWCSHLGLDPDMLDRVEALARQTRVMIFSNTNLEHWEFEVALSQGRLGRFEAYLSYELGLVKPDGAAFAEVARRAGIAPARSLFIDDLAENVAGAEAAGFDAMLFTGRKALDAYLEGRV